jgi:17beta-estradiol 17-dehydrogenase / very-long-chain 3-oxoacyl-CoA reductase
VGMSYTIKYFKEFSEISPNILNETIYCNIMSVVKMTAIVLPGMLKRNGGVIINVSSAAGRMTTPLLTTYSATKAFVDFFSRFLIYFLI